MPKIYLGETQSLKLFLGTTQLKKIYLGSDLVYSNFPDWLLDGATQSVDGETLITLNVTKGGTSYAKDNASAGWTTSPAPSYLIHGVSSGNTNQGINYSTGRSECTVTTNYMDLSSISQLYIVFSTNSPGTDHDTKISRYYYLEDQRGHKINNTNFANTKDVQQTIKLDLAQFTTLDLSQTRLVFFTSVYVPRGDNVDTPGSFQGTVTKSANINIYKIYGE